LPWFCRPPHCEKHPRLLRATFPPASLLHAPSCSSQAAAVAFLEKPCEAGTSSSVRDDEMRPILRLLHTPGDYTLACLPQKDVLGPWISHCRVDPHWQIVSATIRPAR
jgi:hypothetical protein